MKEQKPDRRVLHPKRLILRPPIGMTLLGWLFFERIGAHGWQWGVLGTLAAFVWAVYIVHIVQAKAVDIFPPVPHD